MRLALHFCEIQNVPHFFYKNIICPQLPPLLPLAKCGGSKKLFTDAQVCEQVLDSVDWCSHTDAETLGFITTAVRPLYRSVTEVMDIPTTVSIVFKGTAMQNNISI